MNSRALKDGREVLLDDQGQPLLARLVMRRSDSPGASIKATLVVTPSIPDEVRADMERLAERMGTEIGDFEERAMIPLPFAFPSVSANGYQPNGFEPDFELEMN